MIAVRLIIILLGLYLIYRYIVKSLTKAKVAAEKEEILRAEEIAKDIRNFTKDNKTKKRDNKTIDKFLGE